MTFAVPSEGLGIGARLHVVIEIAGARRVEQCRSWNGIRRRQLDNQRRWQLQSVQKTFNGSPPYFGWTHRYHHVTVNAEWRQDLQFRRCARLDVSFKHAAPQSRRNIMVVLRIDPQ